MEIERSWFRNLKWGGKIRHGKSSRKEAWTSLHSNISAKLKQSLPACTLTKTECNIIMYLSIKAALINSGIASIIVGDIRDGPGRSCGAGVLSLYHCIGNSRISLLVKQLFRDTSLGFIINFVLKT